MTDQQTDYNSEEMDRLADQLYERYGRPMEAEHWGKFVAIARDGRTLLGESLSGLLEEASSTFGPGVFVFKVGEQIVGRWR
jgi:hypothetical protein